MLSPFICTLESIASRVLLCTCGPVNHKSANASTHRIECFEASRPSSFDDTKAYLAELWGSAEYCFRLEYHRAPKTDSPQLILDFVEWNETSMINENRASSIFKSVIRYFQFSVSATYKFPSSIIFPRLYLSNCVRLLKCSYESREVKKIQMTD